ncbi:MAG: hypothetical protein HY321_01195 [Armatimonadetes bacterium]|nr:hypothetical protein [Armatimonadota bacterium]
MSPIDTGAPHLALWAVALFCCAAAALAAGLPILELPKAARAPRVDGDLSDPAWQRAARVSDFCRRVAEELGDVPTEAFVTYDDRALYVAFRCLQLAGPDGGTGEERPGAARPGHPDEAGPPGVGRRRRAVSPARASLSRPHEGPARGDP